MRSDLADRRCITDGIERLIKATEVAQAEHRRCTRSMDAAACAIRLAALEDALAVVQGRQPGRLHTPQRPERRRALLAGQGG